MVRDNLKEAFEVDSVYSAFYTGGTICWSKDGEHLFCQKYDTISIVSVKKGIAIQSLGEAKDDQDPDIINCFAVNRDDSHILGHYKSNLFKLWNWKDKKLIKSWKSFHNGPVTKIIFLNDNLMASGGSDGYVRLWDLQRHTCNQTLKGIQGVISVLEFHPDAEKALLFGAGDDNKIHGWDINTSQQKILLSGHLSKVTSLCFHQNGTHIISSGRDKVLILWDISIETPIRILPVYEEIEGIFIIPNISFPNSSLKTDANSICVASAGEQGTVSIWEINKCKKLYTQENSLVSAAKEKGDPSIMHLIYNEAINSFAVISVDHNILIYSMSTFDCTKQITGYLDEILDIVYVGEQETHIAVANNSIDIKLYEFSSMNCQLLSGHTDSVLSLATTPANSQLLISGAKDNSVRVWVMDKETKIMKCVSSATRHTGSVGSVVISQLSAKFFLSASQDMCLKLWPLPENLTTSCENTVLEPIHTTLAHSKDINSITISMNDEYIATGSHDKTAKLFSAKDLQLIGTFNGHRKGVWCVKFSPADIVLLTTSADCTIKIWSLHDFKCLKTLQGHEASILRAEFMSFGKQFITAGADGLIKIWDVKTSEYICTLDKHEDRVWGLVEEEQKLANLLKANELPAALQIALELNRPLSVLKIVKGLLKAGDKLLEVTIQELTPSCKKALLQLAKTWNTNSKNAEAAQTVLHVLTSTMDIKDMENSDILSFIEGMIPYTERHFKRLTGLMESLHLISYTINRMKPHLASDGVDNLENDI
ncbi:hypothetical protein M0802_003388 [Mischocyttarus mexicanus]|nr:hypothetical protein M0802_003388 [Mischocyttarus mexicanus]